MKVCQNLTAQCFAMLFAMLLTGITINLNAQTTWTGNVSTAWNTPGNWSAGVPDATLDATIPNVTNKPVISIAGALAKSVTVQSSSSLTINNTASLTINNSVSIGLLNQGTVQNSGLINIGNTSAIGSYGIQNEATFNNNTGGQIKIDRVDINASVLYNVSGTFNNTGVITMGANASSGQYGLENMSTFNNNTGGVINIDRIANQSLRTQGGPFTNQGTINIGSLPGGSTMNTGIVVCNSSVFNNTTGAQVNINRVVFGIYNFSNAFSNAGTVTIGALVSVPNLFNDQGSSTFNNNVGGVFKATGTINSASFVNAGGTLSPGYSIGSLTFNASTNFASSIMFMEVNGTGTAGVNYDQIVTSGTATLGGTLSLSINYVPTIGDRITILSASAISGTFSNITGLPANWYVNYTPVEVILSFGPLPTNTWTGSINTAWNNAGNWSALRVPLATDTVLIPNVTNDPVISIAGAIAKSIRVLGGGQLSVATTGTLTINGSPTVALWNEGTVNNNGSINIGNSGNVGFYGIYNSGIFNNNTGAQINVDHATTTGIELLSNSFTNAGTITIGALSPMTNLMLGETGMFSNNTGGTLKGTGNLPAPNFTNAGGTLSPGYSAGKMTFTAAENFTNNILAIEVNGAGPAGITFDQVVVSGVATLGGTLSLSINYAGAVGDVFTIVSATSISGTFTSVTGLPANWNVVYYPSSVVVVYGIPQTTWTGTVSTAWNTPGNWSSGVPDASSDITIPNVINKPVISVAGATAKSVIVQSGSSLTINNTASLTINSSVSIALLNQGTVQNSGVINIGNISAIGSYGIRNEATFNNNTGGQIKIDRVDGSVSALYNIGGTFNNTGVITIGANASSGQYGLESLSTFNNNTGGIINIDRIANQSLHTQGGPFTNQGIINIGSSPGGLTMNTGIVVSNSSVFNNTTGAQVNINRVVFGIYNFSNAFSNAGSVTIGALVSVPNLFYPGGSSTFNNNVGGVFKATGTIRSASFVNAGGTLSPGYSAGLMTFDASTNFVSSIMSMEVNGTGTAGVNYDQIFTYGTATLGGTLSLSINYIPTNGDQVTILSAFAISGTFSSVTGLPAYWHLTYTPTAVQLTYDVTNTWTGNINTAWNTPGNWSAGIVPTSIANVIIPNVTNDPVINIAGASVRTLHVLPGGSLTITAPGSLTTNGVLTFNGFPSAVYNEGTLTVGGTVTVKPD